MEWREQGIVLGTRRHGESGVVLEVMTRGHGRHLGLVRFGRSVRMQPILQVSNRLDLVWRARLDEHLGMFQVEPLEFNAARFLVSDSAVYGVQTLAAHLRLLPERDPHPGLFDALEWIFMHIYEPSMCAVLLARFELAILDELGFRLDLAKCVLTGACHPLAYVSPKTGRAVTQEAGAPWADRLLPLPAILSGDQGKECDLVAVQQSLALTGHFLRRRVYEPRGIAEPNARVSFLASVLRKMKATQ